MMIENRVMRNVATRYMQVWKMLNKLLMSHPLWNLLIRKMRETIEWAKFSTVILQMKKKSTFELHII